MNTTQHAKLPALYANTENLLKELQQLGNRVRPTIRQTEVRSGPCLVIKGK